MPGYSGTPLVKKLGIKPGHVVVLLNAPADFPRQLVDLPDDVRVRSSLPKTAAADVILLFATSVAVLTKHLPRGVEQLAEDGSLWACWLQKSSGVPTDLTQASLMEIGLATGLVDIKVCAVTEKWSGLKFVRRLKDRVNTKR